MKKKFEIRVKKEKKRKRERILEYHLVCSYRIKDKNFITRSVITFFSVSYLNFFFNYFDLFFFLNINTRLVYSF